MRGIEYRDIVRKIIKAALRASVPGLKQKERNEVARVIANSVHARMYGADVDGVASPLWREIEPDKTAQEILDEANAAN